MVDSMSKRRTKLSDQMRHAIEASGMSRYAVCKEIGLSQSTMSRFMHGEGGLSIDMLDRIADVLKIDIVAGVKAGKGK